MPPKPKKNIILCTKDTGGAKGAIPVGAALITLGHNVHLFASGKAREMSLVKNFDGPVHMIDAAEDITRFSREQHWSPDAVVTSMDSEGGPGRDLMNYMFPSKTLKRFALQDFWGQRMRDPKAWAWSTARPHYLFVNDSIGVEASASAWPDFPRENIRALGYPALDRFKDLVSNEAKDRAQRKLNRITNDAKSLPLVVWSGQLRQSGEILKLVAKAINQLGTVPKFKFLARKHPDFEAKAQDQHGHWNEALAMIAHENCITDFPTESEELTMDLLNQTAAIVMSVYSTALVERAALRGPAIAFINDESRKKIETDTGLKEFPLVTLGCAAQANTLEELTKHMRLLLTGDTVETMVAAQVRHFEVDGGNARRVAEFISSKLN